MFDVVRTSAFGHHSVFFAEEARKRMTTGPVPITISPRKSNGQHKMQRDQRSQVSYCSGPPLCFLTRRGGPLADDDGLDAVLSGGRPKGGGRGGNVHILWAANAGFLILTAVPSRGPFQSGRSRYFSCIDKRLFRPTLCPWLCWMEEKERRRVYCTVYRLEGAPNSF